MKILQLITTLGRGGAEQVVCQLALGLADRGHSVELASLWDVGDDRHPLVGDLDSEGVAVHSLNVRSKLDVSRFRDLIRLIREGGYDVVHTHLWHADMVGRAASIFAQSFPLISTVHTAERRWMPWRFAADHLTAQSCEKIVCVSESVKKFHRARCSLPLSRYEVIPNGLDLKWLSDRPSREAARSALGIPADSWVVGTVARLEPEKNLPMLIDAFELTARNVKGVQLVIAGGGRLERALQERINRSPVEQCVRLLGYQADIRPVLAALDVFALASDWEGFGLATAEAMACGLPVIVTNVPGSRDLVGENLRGWLTPVGDAEAMAIRLEKAFFDSRSTHNRACAASEFAHRELGLDAMVDRYLQVYSQVSGVA